MHEKLVLSSYLIFKFFFSSNDWLTRDFKNSNVKPYIKTCKHRLRMHWNVSQWFASFFSAHLLKKHNFALSSNTSSLCAKLFWSDILCLYFQEKQPCWFLSLILKKTFPSLFPPVFTWLGLLALLNFCEQLHSGCSMSRA